MPLDLILGVAVGAAAASTRVRQTIRRGLVYGLGSVLVAYDKAVAMAHDAAQGVRQGAAAARAGEAAPAAPEQASAANTPSADAARAEPAAASPSI